MLRLFTFISLLTLSIFLYIPNIYAQYPYAISENKTITKQASATDIVSSLEKAVSDTKIKTSPTIVGSAELGFLYKTGNTNSGDIKTGVDLRFDKGAWLSLINIDLLLKKADVADEDGHIHFKTTDQKWTFDSKTNYSLDSTEKNYIYGNIWYEENEFSSFNNQSSVSTGWGRHWYKSSNASLWGDVGPGYKRDLFKATNTEPQSTAQTWIVQAQVLYIRKLNEYVEFKQNISIKQALKSSKNSIYKAETAVTTKLISTLQLKFTLTLDYNSKVEVSKENLDTQTAATLVYSF